MEFETIESEYVIASADISALFDLEDAANDTMTDDTCENLYTLPSAA